MFAIYFPSDVCLAPASSKLFEAFFSFSIQWRFQRLKIHGLFQGRPWIHGRHENPVKGWKLKILRETLRSKTGPKFDKKNDVFAAVWNRKPRRNFDKGWQASRRTSNVQAAATATGWSQTLRQSCAETRDWSRLCLDRLEISAPGMLLMKTHATHTAFHAAGPRVWNNLMTDLSFRESLTTFFIWPAKQGGLNLQPGHPSVSQGNAYRRWLWPQRGKKRRVLRISRPC